MAVFECVGLAGCAGAADRDEVLAARTA